MNKRLTFLLLSLMVVFSMALSACGPAATPTEVATEAPTTPATEAPTAVPPTAAAPTPTPPPPPVCDKLADAPAAPAAGQLGASDTPITMAFVPSGEAGVISTASSAIADCLNKMTGLSFTIQTGTSYAAAIEAMGAGKAQVGFLNTFSILAAQAKYGIVPALINLRKYATNDLDPDKDLKGQLEPFYRGQFIANASAGIKTFEDLKGKSFCFVDPLSTSGYIVPRIVLKANGIDPDTDFKATQNAGSHPNVAAAVYKGDCDAGVTFINVLTDATLNTTYPDIQQKVVVFADTDRIPNDGVQYVKDLDPKLQAVITEALLAMSNDPGGKAVLSKLYSINAFEQIDSSFTMYSDFANVLKQAGVDPASLIK
ncbi:MAG TPA: phosphate/phosphite/phosphonate ABC transporter substrate-binding protein [Anaerolineales bacterium]|nr:phosphate/phosphite/phosphonate ABC transporter substrate-binding protein [Anaerolineales bacterium]